MHKTFRALLLLQNYFYKKKGSHAFNRVYNNNNNYSGPLASFYYSTRSVKFMYNIITSFNLYHFQTLHYNDIISGLCVAHQLKRQLTVYTRSFIKHANLPYFILFIILQLLFKFWISKICTYTTKRPNFKIIQCFHHLRWNTFIFLNQNHRIFI